MPSKNSAEYGQLTPQCQTAGCQGEGGQMLRSKKNGLELYLCADCASRYYEQGWTKVRGDVELIENYDQ